MNILVAEITNVEKKAYMGNDKTYFIDGDGNSVYTFAKVVEGETYEGTLTEDRSQKLQFKKTPKDFVPGRQPSQNTGQPKLEDPAKQESIMRMNALTNAVNFYAIDKTGEIEEIFNRMLNILKGEKPAQSGYEAAKATAQALKPEPKEQKAVDWKSDEPTFDDKEIDLESIPF